MATSTAHALFNRKLMDMFEDLAACFPSVPEFGIAISPTARMLLNMDPRQGQRIFNDFVAVPFESRIIARDDAFLLAHDQFGPDGGAGAGNLVALIKGVWKDSSAEDKDAIWKHLHVLIVLSRRCMDQ